ncbi:MAG: TolC family protein [Desulfosalsimonadaceae bacterium]
MTDLKKASFSIKKIWWSLLPAAFLLLLGCTGMKDYSADGIREEYRRSTLSAADPAHNGPFSGTPAGRAPPADGKSPDFPLTLQQSIATALANNPNLQQKIHRMARAQATRNLSKAAFWPSLEFYTEYMQGDSPSAHLFRTIDQRKLKQNANFNEPGWFENYETGIKARMNLFNGGRDYLNYRMAKKNVSIRKLDRQSATNELKSRVIAGFYDVLAARRFVTIAEESVASVSRQLSIKQVQHRGGSALESEVLSLKARQTRAKEDLIKSRNRLKLARASLASLMGLDPSSMAEKPKLLDPDSKLCLQLPQTYEEGIIYALAHRPELQKARKQLIKSRMGVDAAKAGYLPQLDLTAKYYMDDPDMDYTTERENWTAALVLNWDLFSGFATGARVDKADAMVEEILAADRQATLNVQLDVKSAYLERDAARARHEVAQSSADSAEASYRIVKAHYRGGSATITRYLEAELARSRAQVRKTAALYNKIKAEADLARALGRWAGLNPQLSKNDVIHEE